MTYTRKGLMMMVSSLYTKKEASNIVQQAFQQGYIKVTLTLIHIYHKAQIIWINLGF